MSYTNERIDGLQRKADRFEARVEALERRMENLLTMLNIYAAHLERSGNEHASSIGSAMRQSIEDIDE